jgi:hypothetical protein
VKTILAFCFSLIAVQTFSQNYNDRSTTGPVPPKGVDVVGYVSTAKALTVEKLITGVPAYIWYEGCGPTVIGMLCGYYDSHGFPGLLPGDAATQTTAVNSAIASTEHIDDYAKPKETALPVQPDKSELPAGDEHTNNCIADFMLTSRSIIGNIWGWSKGVDIKPSWENYIANYAPEYVAAATQYYYNDIPIWDTLVSNIDKNKPMLLLVDTNLDGLTDHFVIVNGYKIENDKNYYGCFNTWDSNQHWYEFAQMGSGIQWGVARCYTFSIHHKLPVAAGTISGPSNVCIGMTPVEFTVPMIDDATSYVWTIPSGATGSSSTNSISLVFASGSASGNIIVNGHNANGDGAPSSLSVTVNTTPTAPSAGDVTQPTCSVSTGSVLLSGLPSSGTWTLTRNPDGITYEGAGASAAISGLLPGTYTFTVTNASSCISSSSTEVFIDAGPTTPSAPAVGTITEPSCSIATGTVELSGLPAMGTWTLTRTPGNIVKTGTGTGTSISGLSPGSYTYTVTNGLGCTSLSSAAVVITDQPATPSLPAADLTQPACSVPTGTIVVTSPKETGIKYSIDATTYTNTSGIFNSVAPGTYILTAKNSSGCISAGTSLTINTQPSTPSTPSVTVGQPDCSVSKGTITVTSPTGTGITYSIDGTTYTNTTGIFTAVPSGTYTITAKNLSGCISSGTTVLIIVQPATPTAPVATLAQPSCSLATGAISITSPTGQGMTYSLNGTSYYNTSGIFTAVAAGTYSLTARNSAGCISAGTSATINQQPETPPAPVITLADNVLHSSSASGNNWYNQDGIMANATGQDYTVTISGIYHVIVTKNGCSSAPSNSMNVIFTGDESTSSSEHKIKAYPNPFDNELIIERSGSSDVSGFEIFNSLGQVIVAGEAAEKTVVGTSGLPRGVYILRVGIGKSAAQIKIIRK